MIHSNRWFFWTIAALFFATLGTMALLQVAIREIERDAFVAQDVAPVWTDPEYPLWHSFRPEGFGMALKYPPGWQVEIDRLDGNVFTLENSEDFSENITFTITAPKNEKLIRLSLKIDSEEDIIVGGEPGKWIHGADARDLATANVVLVQHAGQLYHIAGSAREFERIVGSIKFLINAEKAVSIECKNNYRSIKYGFEVQLPEGMFCREYDTLSYSDRRSIDVIAADFYPLSSVRGSYGPPFLIQVTERPIEEVVSKESNIIEKGTAVKNVTVGGISGKKVDTELEGTCTTVVLDSEPQAFVISSCSHQHKHDAIFNQILSTFKFTK